MVTNGHEEDQKNNQPVCENDLVVIHNGIITNYKSLWENNNLGERQTDLDSEIIPALINKFKNEGISIQKSIKKVFSLIKGMASVCIIPKSGDEYNLATNNGSLYYSYSEKNSDFIFASERHILKKTIEDAKLTEFDIKEIKNLKPGKLLTYDITNLKISFDTDNNSSNKTEQRNKDFETFLHIPKNQKIKNRSLNYVINHIPLDFENFIKNRTTIINNIKRCTKCILPETFPFINFDTKGECNYCRDYSPAKVKPQGELEKELDKYRIKNSDQHDCLIPFSGGRDSSYVLHYMKKEAGLNPIAFSYDWGMLTDLGRRNQSIMCSELGIEHILISADIRKKRRNINKNVSAWLKRPRLGTIPLFMAGDKQYFYYNNLLQVQNDLKISIMGENHLEKTGFKVLFSGASMQKNGVMARHLSNWNKVKMMKYYGKEFLLNPSYLNNSIVDTTKAFISYYGIKHNFLNIFDYLKWDESTINNTITKQYGWETDPGTSTTWRIGDGTAAFYNYIYYTVAGFTENDTFRSNQIREGLIDREEALAKVQNENKPRWDSFQWYCRSINIDWQEAVKTINDIPSIYER